MRPAGWLLGTLLSVATAYVCRPAGLAPSGDKVVGAVGCIVVFPGLERIDSTGIVQWEYKPKENDPALSILVYYVEPSTLNIHPIYKERVAFNQSSWSLELKMQLKDGGLYRLRRQEEEKSGKWIRLEVLEPLAKPELSWNSSMVGSTIEVVCKVAAGKVDSYRWEKDQKPLADSGRYHFSRNHSVLHILNATHGDLGHYTCKVTNEVSENETSWKLTISDSSVVVANGVIAGVAVITAVLLLVRDGDLYSE
ncbi:hepatic and glial cell adhesion molecule-like isoform X2 [Pelodiscus sinensis]|uniref:hepatic and glial cell adhesion molecule-like isoform X2 n=1 Tax=Pelodiscus sinensis TaxID=13735 RepID=UPI003F6C75A5